MNFFYRIKFQINDKIIVIYSVYNSEYRIIIFFLFYFNYYVFGLHEKKNLLLLVYKITDLNKRIFLFKKKK